MVSQAAEPARRLSRLGAVCLLLFSLFPTVARAKECYYPDGSIPANYTYLPCESKNDGNNAACCVLEEGDICLDSGLCDYPKKGYVYRGACTDKDWEDPACPKLCSGYHIDSWAELKQCTQTKYCCDVTDNCCIDGSKLFTLDEDNTSSDITTATTPTQTTVSTAEPTSSLALSQTTDTAQSSKAVEGQGSGDDSGEDHDDSTKLGVGVGVGIGGAVGIAVGALGFWLFKRSKKRRQHATVAVVTSEVDHKSNVADSTVYPGPSSQCSTSVPYPSPDYSTSVPYSPEQPTTHVPESPAAYHEGNNTAVSELPAHPVLAEADGNAIRYRLD